MIKLELIGLSEVYENVKPILEKRRLQFYSLAKLTEMYHYEKQLVLKLYDQLGEIYDVNSLNFARKFNLNSRYVEECAYHRKNPKKEELIEKLLIFFETKFLIKTYLKRLKGE